MSDDFRFALEALGFGGLLSGMTPARFALCGLGACLALVGCAGLLLLAI